MSEINELRPFAFVLAVTDMERSAAYFRDALGFRVEWADASDWRLLSRGDVRIMIGHCPNALSADATGDHSYFGYVHVDDADALYEEFVERGALILHPPRDVPYGMREFTVATPDGHRFVVGQVLARKQL